ncbi:hypothetical protein ABTD45_19380, partial [Acinetobacter baumannii]
RNKQYTLSHNSDTSLNLIGVYDGEVVSCRTKTHIETKPAPMDVNMKKQCFERQGFGHLQADSHKY